MKAIDFRRSFRYLAVLCAVVCGIAAAARGATSKTNPVTGDPEEYTNTFTGSTDEWIESTNWDTGNIPFISGGGYAPALVEGKTVSTSTAIDGWTLRVGAYNGANITWSGGITKIQAGSVGCWLTADKTSKITIASFGGNQLEGSSSEPFKLSSASVGGITWSSGLTSASNTSLPFWYYLAGEGTVVYDGDITVANEQVIKQADITLSGSATKTVSSKTLITFGSGTTKTFTADATIKRLNSSGEDLNKDTALYSIVSGATTLTADSNVGACELVKTDTGIDLYWVDGDPSDVTEKTYKPSININFTNGNGLTTKGDVGLAGYEVPGTSWNNYTIPNNSTEQNFATVNAVDSTGAASVLSGINVKVSNHRGCHRCASLTATDNPLHGYIDEGASLTTPTVTVSGIPYDYYRVIVYTATDTANVSFGYLTINGINYTYVDGTLTEGTTAWGASGAYDNANAIAEGVNVLVSPVTMGSSLVVVGHKDGTSRGCIAAVQIIECEYAPEVGADDLEIPVSGETEYSVDSSRSLSGTVYLTGSGTLTLSGSEKITAEKIEVGKDVVLNINADRLDATTFVGSGTVVYNNAAPETGKGWASQTWAGTLWLKNYAIAGLNPSDLANARSTLRLSGCTGYFNNGNNTNSCEGTLDLQNDAWTYAFSVSNGWSSNGKTIFAKLTGSGLLGVQTRDIAQRYIFKDASGFTGTINLAGRTLRVIFGDGESLSPPNGSITIASGATVTVPSGKTWTANANGFIVNGTLNIDGTLASSAAVAVSGSGTVVFNNKAPSPTGDNTWWQNSAWQGTVEIRNYSTSLGQFHLETYGNSDSKVCLNGVSGDLYSISSSGNHNIKELIIGSGGFTQNGDYEEDNTFNLPCKISGSGTYTLSATGTGQKTLFVSSGDVSEFTGRFAFGGENNRVVIGSSTESEFVHGSLIIGKGGLFNVPSGSVYSIETPFYIDEGGSVTNNGTIAASAGFVVNGTLYVNGTLSSTATTAAISGTGTVAFTGRRPDHITGYNWWTDEAWKGTVWIRGMTGITGDDNASTGIQPNSLGNSNSKVKFSGVSGWIEAPVEYNPGIVLENDIYDYALQLTNGNSPSSIYPNRSTIIKKLSGSGTLSCGGTSPAAPTLIVYDASGFTGAINTTDNDSATKLIVVFCKEDTVFSDSLVDMFINKNLQRTIYVASGAQVSLSAKVQWYAKTGIIGDGKVTVDTTGVELGEENKKVIAQTGSNNYIDPGLFSIDENSGYKILLVGESDLYLIPDIVEITVEDKEGALATVSVDNVIVMPHGDEGTTYSVPLGSTVKVVYESLAGEFLKEYTLENAEAGSVVQFQQMLSMLSMASLLSPLPGHGSSDEQEPYYAASIGGSYYDTFAAAVEEYKEGDTIILLDNAEYPFAAGVSLVINLNNFKFTPQVADEENETVLVAVDEESGLATFTFAFRALSDEFTVKAASDADAADVAALVVVATPSDEVAAVVSAEEYDSYFLKTATKTETDSALKTGGTTQECDWSVSIALDSTKVLPTDEEKTAEMLNAVIALATGASEKATIPTKAGLYYWLAATAELGGKYIDGNAVLGYGGEMELTKPELPEDTTKAFYKVRVAPLPPAK